MPPPGGSRGPLAAPASWPESENTGAPASWPESENTGAPASGPESENTGGAGVPAGRVNLVSDSVYLLLAVDRAIQPGLGRTVPTDEAAARPVLIDAGHERGAGGVPARSDHARLLRDAAGSLVAGVLWTVGIRDAGAEPLAVALVRDAGAAIVAARVALRIARAGVLGQDDDVVALVARRASLTLATVDAAKESAASKVSPAFLSCSSPRVASPNPATRCSGSGLRAGRR